MQLTNVCNVNFRAPRHTYHFLECTFYGPNNQALMWDLLLGEEACWRGAGRAWGPHTTTQGGRPCQRPAVGGRVVGLLSQAGGREDGRVPQDVHDLLQLFQDMVLQQFGSDHSCTRPSVSIKQGPVVQVDPICFLEKQEGKKGKEKRWSPLHSHEWGDKAAGSTGAAGKTQVTFQEVAFWNGVIATVLVQLWQEEVMSIFATCLYIFFSFP